MGKEKLLELKDLTKIYVNMEGAQLVVNKINLTVNKGEFISFVGPSGCGKTTILNMIAGLIAPTYGELKILGESISLSTSRLGYMQQQDYLYPWRTIIDNVLIGLEIRKEIKSDSKQKAIELLEILGIEATSNKYPHQLSGGMRQRVALARTLITNPELLLLDEPFSSLDMHIKLQLEELVHSTLKKMGKTAILVTHDLAEAIAISDRVIVLGRNPGHIRKIVKLPHEINKLGPIEARKHPSYQMYIDELWYEFEDEMEKEGD